MTIELGIIGAMESEVEILKSNMTQRETKTIAGGTFHTGVLLGLPVVLARSGVGKINAAMAAQVICGHFHAKRLVNVGIAGGLDENMGVGDMVVSTALMHHDIDPRIFEANRTVTKKPGNKADKWPGFFEADIDLVNLAVKACQALQADFAIQHIYTGHIASGDWFIADSEKKDDIKETYNALCVEMEGAAIAQVAMANEVPFVVIRAISDLADEGAADSFLHFEQETARKAAQVIETMIIDIVKAGQATEI